MRQIPLIVRRFGAALVLGLSLGLLTSAVILSQQVPPHPTLGSGGFVMPLPPAGPTPTVNPIVTSRITPNPTQEALARHFLTRVPTPDIEAMRPQLEAVKARALATQQRRTPVVVADATRGKPITIAGRRVQLPPDAYIAGTTDFLHCVGNNCPDIPSILIQRGNSRVYVGTDSGKVFVSHIAPGEERNFDFLAEALR